MCFGDGGSSKRIAEQSRADEVARQNRIREGMASIARAFDGGLRGSGVATEYDPSKTYYNADGSVFAGGPQGLPSGDVGVGEFFRGAFGSIFGADSPLAGRSPQEKLKAGQLFTGTAQSGGFNEDFYKKRQQDYVNYATPELERQAAKARKQLVFALARTGNLASSAAIDKNTEFDQDVNKERIGIANQGLDLANQTRTQVENTRSGVVSELNATGDNEAATQTALRQAVNLTTPAGYSPVGQLFQTFSQGLSAIGSNPNNGFGGFAGARSLFGSGKGSQRVVGG